MDDKDLLRLIELNKEGEYLYKIKRYKEAKEIFDKAIEYNPKYIGSYYNKAYCEYMLSNYKEAEKIYKKIILIDKKEARAYWFLAIVGYEEDNIEKSIEFINKAIYYGYDNEHVYCLKGNLLENINQNDEALRCYNKSIQKNSLFYKARIDKAKLYKKLNKVNNELKCYDEIIINNPDIFQGYYLKAITLINRSNYAEAENIIDKGIEVVGEDINLLRTKVNLCKLMDKYSESINIIDKCLQVQPNDIKLITEKGRILGINGKASQGIDFIKNNIDSYKYTDDVNYCLSNLYIKINDYDNAATHMYNIIEAKNIPIDYRILALYEYPLIIKKKGDTDKAKEYFENAISEYRLLSIADPSNKNLKIFRALCLKQLNRYDEAIEYLDYILAIDDNCAQSYAIKGIIYDCMGDIKKSERCISKSKSIDKYIKLDYFKE